MASLTAPSGGHDPRFGSLGMRVNEAMCVEFTANKEGRKGSVRNVSFVNAQVKVVNCTVNNLSVDISQISVGPSHPWRFSRVLIGW